MPWVSPHCRHGGLILFPANLLYTISHNGEGRTLFSSPFRHYEPRPLSHKLPLPHSPGLSLVREGRDRTYLGSGWTRVIGSQSIPVLSGTMSLRLRQVFSRVLTIEPRICR